MRTVLVIGVAVLLAGCQRPETIAGVSDSAFVRAMAELRRLPTTPAIGQAARDRARDSILRLHGITAAQLEAATLSLADKPERAAALFRAIEGRSPELIADPPIRQSAKKDSVTK